MKITKKISFENLSSNDKYKNFQKIFDVGMSFNICKQSKLMPNITVFNNFFGTGVDDIDDSDSVITWMPFIWSDIEYESLIKFLNKKGYQLLIDQRDFNNYHTWFDSILKTYEKKIKTKVTD